ncbi:MAG: large conductance mechanosensitive channel protein MscL [Acutalibacteraceae bacterium]|nr:large conductance mechanosensitive channel protein MscL [Acutalibacteraceae bacterium]
MKKFFQEFKEFAMKGNVLDMAVGVVVGGAFKEIVTALVNNIINPLIGALTGQGNLSDLKYVISEAVIENGVEVIPENAVTYGVFLQSIIDFLIIAFSIFVALKVMMNAEKKLQELLHKKKEEEEAATEAAAEPVEDEISVLKEIRDMLKNDKKAE